MTSLIIQDKTRTDPPPPRHHDSDRKLVLILTGILLLAIVYTLYLAKFLLLPVAIALLLAALLQPLSARLHKMRLPEELSSAIVVLLLIALVGFSAYRLYYPAAEWFGRGPHIIGQAEFKFGTIKKTIREARQATRRLEEATKLEGGKEQEVVLKGPSLTDKFLSQTQTFVVTSYITLVLLFFLLARGRVTLERWIRSLADPGEGEKWKRTFQAIQREITRYLGTITLINGAMAVAIAISMTLLGMPNPVLWGVVVGCLRFIPYVGGLISTTILTLVALITFDTPLRILLPPLVFLVLSALEGNFVTPMVAGKRLGLNPLLLMVALLFWGWIWGIAGILMAVPIQASIKIISRNIPSLYPLREIIR